MKKQVFALMAMAAMFTACQIEVLAPENEPEITTPVIEESVFPDVIIASSGNDDTKAWIDRYDAGGGTYRYRHHWDLGDIIYVYKGTERAVYTCSNVSTGEFSKGATTTISGGYSFTDYCAAFSTVGEITVNANNKLYVDNSLAPMPQSANFMVAKSADGTHYTFTSLVGWVKLSLKSPRTITNIAIAKYGLGEDYEGRLYYDYSSDSPSWIENQGESVYYSFSPGIALNTTTATDIYLALPPMSYDGLPFEIQYSDASYEYFSTSNTVLIEQNKVTPMAVKEIGFIYSTLESGSFFNIDLKNLAAGTDDKEYTSEDLLVKGIVLSLGEASPTPTTINVADESNPAIYASFDDGTGIVTLHTTAHRVSLNKDCRYMFYNFKELESIEMLSQVITSQVGESGNNMSGVRQMFQNCTKLASVDISKLNTTQAPLFNGMFSGCAALSSIDVSTLNTAAGTSFSGMFTGCSSLTSLDVSSFNTSSSTAFDNMFYNCSGLLSIDLGSEFFKNGGIRSLDAMFGNCSNLTSITLTASASGSMYIYSPYNGSFAGICAGCTSLTSFVSTLPGYVTSYDSAFRGCSNLETVDFGSLTEYTSATYSYMFDGCYKLNYLDVHSFLFSYIAHGDPNRANVIHMFRDTCRDSDGLDLYIKSGVPKNNLSCFFNERMKGDGFITYHN